jgi:hypothetical protein
MVEILRVVSEILTPIGVIVTAVASVVLYFLRRKDRDSASSVLMRLDDIDEKLEVMDSVEECLRTIARKYWLNVTHEQAGKLIEQAYHIAELNIKCWVCRYIRAGHPEFNRGKWCVDDVVMGAYYSTVNRLNPFLYQENNLNELVDKGEFEWLKDRLKDVIHKYDDVADAKERVESEIAKMVVRALERLGDEEA